MLVAQAIVHGMTILTPDPEIEQMRYAPCGDAGWQRWACNDLTMPGYLQ